MCTYTLVVMHCSNYYNASQISDRVIHPSAPYNLSIFYASEFPYIKLEKIQEKVRYYFCNYTLHSFYLIYMGDRDKQLPIVSLQLF